MSEDGGNTISQNVGTYIPVYTASYTKAHETHFHTTVEVTTMHNKSLIYNKKKILTTVNSVEVALWFPVPGLNTIVYTETCLRVFNFIRNF
jgi:predicted metal-dependent HD superfamily phosphohydrolase